MRNGFGLRLLHKFLGLPFLSLQKDTLLSLLQRNQREAEVCGLELHEFLVSFSFSFDWTGRKCNPFNYLFAFRKRHSSSTRITNKIGRVIATVLTVAGQKQNLFIKIENV